MGNTEDFAHALKVVALALLALVGACSRSSTDFCSTSAPVCPDGYTCVDDRCQFGVDAGTDGGVTAVEPGPEQRQQVTSLLVAGAAC